MKFVVAALLALAAAVVQASDLNRLVIYHDYRVDVYTCSVLQFEGTPSIGSLRAECEALRTSPVEDRIFAADFEPIGYWEYVVYYDGEELYQDNCALLVVSSSSITLGCQ